MSPIEKLIKAVRKDLEWCGPCEDAEQPDESPYCNDYDCVYCKMAKALDEYNRAPKPFVLPFEIALPNWSNIWLAVGENCFGNISDAQPLPGVDGWLYGAFSCRIIEVGLLKIPPGKTWRDCCVQIRKDGVDL